MDSHSSDSEGEAPEEFSFKDSNKEVIDQKELQKKELLSVKNELKRIRRLNHEKNMLQQEEKRKKLEELESKKLPEELLNSVKDSIEEVEENKIKKKRRKKKKVKVSKKFVSSVQDSVIVEVRPLSVENKGVKTLQSIAEDFKRNKITNNKGIKRMPSRELRAIKEKRIYGGKT
ncbi:UNVERIFIED_CONTAM: hypothetical protein RMT77_009697 [Armadillidium vulgare]